MTNDRGRLGTTSLNYHHLQYFWAVAREGNLTRAAKLLHVSQSALSAQIRQLETELAQDLFERRGRTLELTEAGHIALAYANDIFTSGRELLATLDLGRKPDDVLRIGAVSTQSRNFQDSFISPLLGREGVRLRLVAGKLRELLDRLVNHELDLVLSNQVAAPSEERAYRCRHIARQPVSLIGHPDRKRFRWPHDVDAVPLIVPSTDSSIRTSFDALCEKLGLAPRVVAEVDDMAMMRLLTRDMKAVALLPSVVVRDELQTGILREVCVVPGLHEDFVAITVERRYRHPLVELLLNRGDAEILAMGPTS